MKAHDRLKVTLVPCLKDNYTFIIEDTETHDVGVVDPTVGDKVVAALETRGLKPTHLFITHHHPDHIGGVPALLEKYDCFVIGPASETARIGTIDEKVKDGDRVHFGHHEVHVIDVPGHTAGHVAYWFADAASAFVGDTLFALGCGRLFEGTPDQMWHSLLKLRKLPAETRIYCAHEYTRENARFAWTIEPENAALSARSEEIDRLRAEGIPTIPTSIGLEKMTNPFLRADVPELAAAIGMAGAEPVSVFAEVRHRKDVF